MSADPKSSFKSVPKKYHPRGFELLHEDLDIIVGNKAAGLLTVAALWEKEKTVHNLLNQYVRKGNPKSHKCVYVVHRLDQATTGVLVFAKSEKAQLFLKDNWRANKKTYLAIVHGKLKEKSGTVSSYLSEDEDYVIHSSQTDESGKLSHTEYQVLKETAKFSLVQINLLTGRKNQIRVHMAELGHPLVGDSKYGPKQAPYPNLALHSVKLELTHPFRGERMQFAALPPGHFKNLVDFNYQLCLNPGVN